MRPGRIAALERNHSNAAWLIDALLKAASVRAQPVKVQLLHREGDPQLTESLGEVPVALVEKGNQRLAIPISRTCSSRARATSSTRRRC